MWQDDGLWLLSVVNQQLCDKMMGYGSCQLSTNSSVTNCWFMILVSCQPTAVWQDDGLWFLSVVNPQQCDKMMVYGSCQLSTNSSDKCVWYIGLAVQTRVCQDDGL